jgi:hypothetical protein
MNYNYMFLFLQKMQLSPIDAACQELQYVLQNSARAIFFFLSFFFFRIFIRFDRQFYSIFFLIVCTNTCSKFNTFYVS